MQGQANPAQQVNPVQGQVKYVNRGVEHFGAYKLDGRMLELTCRHGTRRAVLGLFEAKVLARKLLRFLVTKGDRESVVRMPRPAEVEERKIATPMPSPIQPKASSPPDWARLPLIQARPTQNVPARPRP